MQPALITSDPSVVVIALDGRSRDGGEKRRRRKKSRVRSRDVTVATPSHVVRGRGLGVVENYGFERFIALLLVCCNVGCLPYPKARNSATSIVFISSFVFMLYRCKVLKYILMLGKRLLLELINMFYCIICTRNI